MENKKSLQLCDACCEGRLHPVTYNEPVEYKGTQGQLIVHYSVCDVCKAEISDASDLLKNKRELVRFKKRVDHVPLGTEIVELRSKHNLTQPLAAAIFGGGPVAFSKYENDDLIPDEAMVSLLKLAISYPDTVQRLARIKKIALPPQMMVLDKFQFEVPASKWAESPYTAKVKRGHAASELTKSKGTSKMTRRTISKSSGGLVKKIKNGDSEWTLQ